MANDSSPSRNRQSTARVDGKDGPPHDEQSSSTDRSQQNLAYEEDEEPEIHMRTYIALAAMFVLNFVQVFALQGPPAVLPFIADDLGSSGSTWVPNALSLVQAVLGPVISSASDAFQARKIILVATCIVSFVGAAIAPGSQDIYRLIAAQVLIGFGFAAVPLVYCIPSEILPRRWRPAAQGAINVAATLGAVAAPLTIGALVRADAHGGWRKYYWFQMALWGVTTIGILLGYRPPKRHTRLDHMSLLQKIRQLDLVGFLLLSGGLALFLTGLNLGNEYEWTDSRVLGTLLTGIAVLIAFFLFEWKGTRTGMLHHELFRGGKERGRTFAICTLLIFIEGIMLFSIVIFYPVLTINLFETDPFLSVARGQPFWIACALSTMIYGYVGTRRRSIRMPMFVGFLLFTAGLVGMATVQPGDSLNAIAFNGLAGLGFGAPLVLIVAGVQLSTPHHLIATATAVTTSARAVAATTFVSIFTAAEAPRVQRYIATLVPNAALGAGLPASSLPEFMSAITGTNPGAVTQVSGVTPAIAAAGRMAVKQAWADGLRVVYIIAAPFGALACVACFFLGDLRKVMDYRVDAPVEDLHHKDKDKEQA